MLAITPARRRLYWTLQIGGWAALVPVLAQMNLLANATPAFALFNGFFRQVLGFLLTLGLWRIYRRWPFERGLSVRHAALAVLCVLAATAVDCALFERLARATFPRDALGLPKVIFSGAAFVARAIVYAGWTAVALGLRQLLEIRDRDLRVARAEIAARDSELQALRAQLNPHFLFNALNSILAEADDNPARVKSLTLGLSELLRFSLRHREHFGELGDEVPAIENYLRIEHARFEERLEWRVDVPAAVRRARVPTTLLLPLVENAIKYGLQTSPARLIVRIGAEQRDDRVVAFVENSGHWIEPDATVTRSTGIGLANLRRRLTLLCGPQARVDISHPPGSVRVEVQVPLLPATV